MATLLISASALAARPPVFVSNGDHIATALTYPAAYVAAAPLSNLLDVLTLLSLSQHVALLVTVLVAWALWRLSTRRLGAAWPDRVVGEMLRIAALVAGVAGLYAVGLVTRRPMAALELLEPELVTVDFHSHTTASHDGRRGFTPEANREWHRAAGFDVGYVSDHKTLNGAIAARAYNAAFAGEGTLLLPAVESVCQGHHVVLLGIELADSVRHRRWGCERILTGSATDSARAPLAIFTLPGDPASLPTLPNLVGAELVDGAPRALDHSMRLDAQLRSSARDLRLALLANSNNHGWGRTAVAWNVMRIPGWRGMTPDALDAAIQRQLRDSASQAVTLVERRRVARHDPSLAGLALTVPSIAWVLCTTLSWPERLVWIACIWMCWGLAWAFGCIGAAAEAARSRSVTSTRTLGTPECDPG